MTDLWGFLLQTLTASGAAVLLLVVKAIFRDKLPPKWQFAVWSVLGLVLLVPAGLGGRYALLNWPLWVEAAKTFLTGDYSLTRVLAPIPLPRPAMPGSAAEWLYTAYVAGVVFFLIRYLLFYLRLRRSLRRGIPAGEKTAAQIKAVAEQYGLPPCRAVEIPGLKTAFICGVFRPVLALPARGELDGKILLHELLHYRHRDAVWGLVICFFRCIHWCNPLLWYCADRAGNDLEARCDQRVLEELEGEERRDYGRILLSMADDQYARVPGTSSMANGGRNIGRRIEAIARFKQYPAGMALVSVCITVLLAAPLLLGARAEAVYDGVRMDSPMELSLAMASARTLRCTTPAGALDAYAASVLENSGYYRAMCAPLSEQKAIADRMLSASQENQWPRWDAGLPAWPNTEPGYRIFNLERLSQDAYEGLLVVQLNYPPDGQPAAGDSVWLGAQRVRAELQEGRWVVLPLEDFWSTPTSWNYLSQFAVYNELPSYCYEAQAEGFTIRLQYQTVLSMCGGTQEDNWFYSGQTLSAVYTGDPADQDGITSIGVSYAPIREGRPRPSLLHADMEISSGSSSNGSSSSGANWSAKSLEAGWGPEVRLSGGGGGTSGDLEDLVSAQNLTRPAAYAADLYINGQKAAELTLLSVDGGAAS